MNLLININILSILNEQSCLKFIYYSLKNDALNPFKRTTQN